MQVSLPDSIQTRIFLTGSWEPPITNLIRSSLSEGDIFIDVGANIGYYTLLASKLVGNTGKVYAFEASPEIFKCLETNISINKSLNIHEFNIAVSNITGSVTIWSAPDGNLGHSTIVASVANTDGHHREAEVSCDKLVNLVPLADLLSARFIKIDIEGAERLAIEGVIHHISQFSERTEWLIELSPQFAPGGADDTDWIFHVFCNAGYKAYLIENTYQDISTDINSTMPPLLKEIYKPPSARLNDLIFSKSISN